MDAAKGRTPSQRLTDARRINDGRRDEPQPHQPVIIPQSTKIEDSLERIATSLEALVIIINKRMKVSP